MGILLAVLTGIMLGYVIDRNLEMLRTRIEEMKSLMV